MIVLVGASASGKTELAKILYQRYGYQKCITSTTRNPRIGEKQDIDYHFLSHDEFIQKMNQNVFVEVTPYNQYLYGIQKKDVKKNGVVIVEPSGANTLVNQMSSFVFVVYVHASKALRKKRMLQREDEIKKINERLAYDDDIFKTSNLIRIDLIIENETHDLNHLADLIHQSYQNSMNKKENTYDYWSIDSLKYIFKCPS